MKIAIIGSREIRIENIDKYIPKDITLLISGGARGVDSLAERYADKNCIPKLIYKPEYKKYGKSAPLIRNKLIVENADLVIAIWDGVSTGTKFTIDYAKSIGKKVRLVLIDVTGVELMPGNQGKDCLGVDYCCDECDFLQCCLRQDFLKQCTNCTQKYCPRKF